MILEKNYSGNLIRIFSMRDYKKADTRHLAT